MNDYAPKQWPQSGHHMRRASPVIPCDCGCWPDLSATPGWETWMAIYLDLLDRDSDASLDMLGRLLGDRIERMGAA